MYKHLLLPTDGSPACETAIRQGIRFAKEANAQVTSVHVTPHFHVMTYHSEMLEDTREQFTKDSKTQAIKYLAIVEKIAKEAGVPCDTQHMVSDHTYEALLKAADDKGCDLIAMASHGRKGLKSVLLGSETQRVLTHSKLPVLVFH